MFIITMLSVMILSILWDSNSDRKNQNNREMILFHVDRERMAKIQELEKEIRKMEKQILLMEVEEARQPAHKGNCL